MSKEHTLDRRHFLGVSAGLAAARLGTSRMATEQGAKTKPANLPKIFPGTNTSLGPVKQIEAGVLNVIYAELGRSDGPAVILLHGWPYDIHSYVDVAPMLVSAGYRVLVPYQRGYGVTSFLSSTTFRNGQQSATALDTVALMDALKIEKAILGGFDSGSRTANIVAALWPERCRALVSVGGYSITNRENNLKPLPPASEYSSWYEYYLSTERGRIGYSENRYDFNKFVWKTVSPKWFFEEDTYERTASSFNNPDHVDIVTHDFRWRLGLAEGEPQYDNVERKLLEGPIITVPTITVASDFDGPSADGKGYRNKFSSRYSHRILKGIGRNVPQEAPRAFAQAIVDVERL
jgi:pimeloyl-ACP methyl ester carboxylesterase